MEYISLGKFKQILEKAMMIKASDIHISADSAVYFRRKNKLEMDYEYSFSKDEIVELLKQLLKASQQEILLKMLFMNRLIIF